MHLKPALALFIVTVLSACSTSGDTLAPTTPKAEVSKAPHANKPAPTSAALKGATNCSPNSPDCNSCANNVRQQFNRAIQGKLNWKQKPWRFSWDKQYPPYKITPTALFNDRSKNWLGIPDHHVQGFVRTNSSRYPYAGSHSHAKKGGIFIVEQASNGKKHLKSLFRANTRHPSGVQVIGKYLFYGDGKTTLRLINLDHPNTPQHTNYKMPTAGLKKPDSHNFGGGVGMVRLVNGNYLILSSTPGAQDSRTRYNRFYIVKGNIEAPASIRLIAELPLKKPSSLAKKFSYSENLSLVTECKTGDIYAIHTTGDEKGIQALIGNGYWRLSKLEGNISKPRFTVLTGWTSSQNIKNCHLRSTGSIFVNSKHNMEFNCHGYAESKATGERADKFYFKTGK